ncbi:glycosyltransferase family 4 protein [Cetobacterium somerae]|uniref:glycosyltransferase family 4 protein n=1 Tax=Cetobacterium somerae TaxID=188913 RepID=UPI00211EF301|nr:glycosyltransferase family 4 protein [Cetobacterium somerae]MCQ9626137.1 glycosyltransferase family 4 protein [Cetobacterium somerae]
MKKFVHIYEELETMYLGKPQGMYPTYMKYLGWDSEIVTYNLKNDLPNEVRGVKIKKIKQFLPFLPNENALKFMKRIPLYWYIYKNAKNIDVMMLYHLTKCSYWNSFFYKLGNKNGKIFIKGDFDFPEFQEEVEQLKKKPKTLKEFFRKRKWKKEFKKRFKLVKMMNVFSVETLASYEGIKNYGYGGVNVRDKLLHLPNGFDLKFVQENNIERKTFEEKENIIFTASRLGTKEKNTEFFLEVISKVNLKNWKVVMAGPIEENFKIYIGEFFKKYPHLKEKIIFPGFVRDKKKLYSYYNEAKIFMMTSRGEGFANVFLEALYFGNVIITTKVSSCEDVTDNGNIGVIIEQGDLKGYVKIVEELLTNSNLLKEKHEKTIKLAEDYLWENSAKKLDKKLGENIDE